MSSTHHRAPPAPEGRAFRVAMRWLKVGMLCAVGAGSAFAQTNRTYTAGANGTWGTSSNWSGNNVPDSASERAIFGAATGRTITFNSNTTVGGILFNSTAGSYTISNTTATRTLTLGTYGIVSQSANDQFISGGNLRLTLGGATFFSVNGSGDLSITATGGNITTTGTNIITLNGTGSGMGLISSTINGTGSVTSNGTANWTLSGANSYTGNTTLSSGTLFAGSNTAFGTGNIILNGGTLAASGGTRTLANNVRLSANSTIGGANNIVLNGATTNTRTSSTSVTLNVTNSGTTTLGALALSSDATNRNVVLNVTGSGDVLVNGVISNGGTSTASTLTKNGTGDVIFGGSSSNTYTGTTTISGGTLQLAKTGAATAIAGSIVIGDGSGTDTLQLNANDQIANNAAVTMTAGGTPVFNLNGFSERIGSLSSTNANAQVQFGAPGSPTTFTVGNASSTTYAGTFTSGNANGTLVKEGIGTLALTGASTGFTGAVVVNAGALRIQSDNALGTGTAGTTVVNGAALMIDGGRLNTSNGELTIAGSGAGPTGALAGSGGNNRWNGNITLTGNTTVTTSGTGYLALGTTTTAYNREIDPPAPPADPTRLALSGHTLTLTGTTTAVDQRAIYINSRITGTGNVVVDMTNATDTVRFTANFNEYTGTTTIKNGTLSLRTLANTYPNDPVDLNYFGINGPVVIGDGLGSAGSAKLLIEAGPLYGEQINFATTMSIKRDGVFNLLNNQSISGLTFTGGAVDLGTTGVLFLNGDVTVNASAGNTATIFGTGTSALSLTIHQGPVPVPNAERTFNVVGGVGNTSDLTIGAVINYGGIIKEGAGTMTITSANSGGYEGRTVVNNGTLSVQNNTALGQTDGQTATGTLVNSGGTLQLSNVANGNLTVSGEKLTLNGAGSGGNGALQNLAGNNTWGGSAGIVLGSNATVKSDANTLTISTAITSSSSTLTVTGAGNTTISGDIGTNSGGLVKDGTGTLVLSGNNNFNGGTQVNSGVLSVQRSTALGTTSGGTTVASGAALHLDNTAVGGGANQLNVIAEPLTIQGTGIGGTGAFRNFAGNNTFQGQVNVASSSLITSNSGYSLNMSGGMTSSAGAGHAVTFGTAAQNGNITVSGNISNGSLALTKAGSGNLAFASTSQTLTGTVGAVHLNAGTMTVGSGTHAATLNTGAIDSLAGTTLTIASGGTVSANYASGSTTFSGALAGSGNFQKTGAGTLVFNNSFNASNLTLTLNGGTLSLLGGFTFGTIHITGNTVLDFNNSAGTFLSSANLIIDAGVTVTVNNWVSVANNASASTAWYATNTTNGIQGSGGNLTLTGGTVVGNHPLNQIVFNDYNGMTTTWVSGTSNGWFDREIRPTPEPATYGAIFLSGCLSLLGWRRLRSRKQR